MRKTEVDMKEFKKSLLKFNIETGQPSGKIKNEQMSKRIIDFSWNGIELTVA